MNKKRILRSALILLAALVFSALVAWVQIQAGEQQIRAL